MTRYAFSFDSSACTGCKACQVACKDKHNLPVGILWRQVYEVAGGGWTRQGNAWVSDVFAYHLSLACNHCERPICVEVCPAGAITQRADGIVAVDGDRCLGCRYCSWACPYNAPQYDVAAGRMYKCDLCVDNIDRGLPPACVAGCPLRALELIPDYSADGVSVVSPLPEASLTAPALKVKPHPKAPRAEQGSAKLDQLGVPETQEPRDLSLVTFTIMAQMAVGGIWVLCVLQLLSMTYAQSALIGVAVVASMALAVLASLFHLGTPMNAWRAFSNWRSSWVSREILFALTFAVASTSFAGLAGLQSGASAIAGQLAALVGIALIYSMASAYRLRTVPAWNTRLTFAKFVLTTLLLGVAGVAAITSGDAAAAGFEPTFVLIVSALVIAEWAILWFGKGRGSSATVRVLRGVTQETNFAFRLRLILSLLGIFAFGAASLRYNEQVAFPLGFAFLLTSEVIGRYLFYQMRRRNPIF